jgi:methylenetetrahydrofolate dehydrogenase (NADP+)/methenyltetrahydrofolate cyclohydrolase
MTPTDRPTLLVGTPVAEGILAATERRAREFAVAAGRPVCLAAVLVGDDPASATYVRMKRNRSQRIGIRSELVALPASASTAELVERIEGLSADPAVDGILLQHPVPPSIDERAAFEAIAPHKDVDGVTFHSFGAMALGRAGFVSATPGGIIRLLDAYRVQLAGRRAVVLGRSPILGKPVAMLLLARDATVTMCHSKTRDLPELVGSADVVVAALGRPRFVTGSWIKPGAVVVDAGYNAGNVGDVDFQAAADRAAMITPVPGGVGPMTIAVLLEQTVEAAWHHLAP